jgi:hypothetical protein
MRIRTLALLTAVGASAACATILIEPSERTASVQSRAGSDVQANVRASSAFGATAVSISMIGGEANATHPWHVHHGTCATGGGIVGDAAAYPPLRTSAAGAATATAQIGVQLVPGNDYHVNVHRSPQALNQIIGCGDLR